jgi:hypothetical protein
MQKTLEEIAFLLRIPQRKPWGNMASDVAAALAAFNNRCGAAAAVEQPACDRDLQACDVQACHGATARGQP